MGYEATPLVLTPEKAHKILDELFKVETMFSDYQPACAELCGYCELCLNRKRAIVSNLWGPNSLAYEVWKDDELVGIIYFKDIVPGVDAMGELTFWDKDLRGKAGIINQVVDSIAFGDTLRLHRLTVHVPVKMKSLVRFLERKLGFEIEGTKREAMRWGGEWIDMVILGRVN